LWVGFFLYEIRLWCFFMLGISMDIENMFCCLGWMNTVNFLVFILFYSFLWWWELCCVVLLRFGLLWLLTTGGAARVLDVNLFPAAAEDGDDGTSLSSPSSAVSPFQMDFSMRNGNAEFGGRNKREQQEAEGTRVSDDEENGSTRKKLRLSKEQSAFLEESFKEHTTLNPVSLHKTPLCSFFFR